MHGLTNIQQDHLFGSKQPREILVFVILKLQFGHFEHNLLQVVATLDYSAIQQDFFLSGNQRKVFFLLVSSITEVGYFSSSAQITDGFAHRVGWLVRWLADPAQMAASRFATVTRLPSYAA